MSLCYTKPTRQGKAGATARHLQVLQNVVHVTITGVACTWYFMSRNMPSYPTLGALRRSLTSSFGSICLGSLVVALLQLLRAIASSGKASDGSVTFMGSCFACLLDWIEASMEYFNQYAYVQVTWSLPAKCGLCSLAAASPCVRDEYNSDAIIFVVGAGGGGGSEGPEMTK